MIDVQTKLAALGLVMPQPSAPVAAYVPCRQIGYALHISGQLPFDVDGRLIEGNLGSTLSTEQGAEAARRCALMLVAQINVALKGNWSQLAKIIKLGVFIASTADFRDHPKVANGASILFHDLFGEAGVHARSAVGVASLPLGAAVEIDCCVELLPTPTL